MWGEEESLDTLFRRTVAIHPERIALVDRDRESDGKVSVRYSYRQLADAVTRVSAALFQAGVRQHRVVLIQMASVANTIILKLAIARLGAIACTIPDGFSRTEWRLLLAAIGPDITALAHDEFCSGNQQGRFVPDLPEHCVQCSFSAEISEQSGVAILATENDPPKEQLIQLGEYLGNIHISPDDYLTLHPFVLISGDNKDARLKIIPGSHNHWQGVASFIAERANIQHGDVLVCPNICQEPVLTGVFLFNWLSSGARLVLTGAQNVKNYVECLVSERATFSMVTPEIGCQFGREEAFLDQCDLGGLRSMVVMAAEGQGCVSDVLMKSRVVEPIVLRAVNGALSVIE
ncbi:class I adenylate-forming enzyme family protein [Kistimonas scapharcae]